MSNYLSEIVARSIQINDIQLMPTTQGQVKSNQNIQQDFTDINNPTDDFNQKSESFLTPSTPLQIVSGNSTLQEFSNKNILSDLLKQKVLTQKNTAQFLPNNPLQSPRVETNDIAESKVLEKIVELPYITRHVQRMIVNETSEINKEGLHSAKSTGSNIVYKEHQTGNLENITSKIMNDKPSKGDDSSLLKDSKSIDNVNDATDTKKTSIIHPAVKSDSPKITNDIFNRLNLNYIIPAQLDPGESRPTNIRNNQVTPKLVIGKITVEILPPLAQQPPKIITRVVQAPSTENHSKTNRLSFGLGQS
jgi:hypothetical protein